MTTNRDKVIEILKSKEQTFVFTDSRGLDHPFQGLHHNKYNEAAKAILKLKR